MVHGVELINGGFGMKNPIIAHAQDQRILSSSINPSKLINFNLIRVLEKIL